jgi:hypothetical protein
VSTFTVTVASEINATDALVRDDERVMNNDLETGLSKIVQIENESKSTSKNELEIVKQSVLARNEKCDNQAVKESPTEIPVDREGLVKLEKNEQNEQGQLDDDDMWLEYRF